MAVLDESEAKRRLVKDVQSHGGYARRVEDRFTVGFPDLIVIPAPDFPVFFIEAKIIRGSSFGPTPRQFIELKRLAISKYSVPTLAGWDGEKWYLHYYAEKVWLEDCYSTIPGTPFHITLIEWYLRHVKQP